MVMINSERNLFDLAKAIPPVNYAQHVPFKQTDENSATVKIIDSFR